VRATASGRLRGLAEGLAGAVAVARAELVGTPGIGGGVCGSAEDIE